MPAATRQALDLLRARVGSGQAVNDLNWLRLRNWRETLAMAPTPIAGMR